MNNTFINDVFFSHAKSLNGTLIYCPVISLCFQENSFCLLIINLDCLLLTMLTTKHKEYLGLLKKKSANI